MVVRRVSPILIALWAYSSWVCGHELPPVSIIGRGDNPIGSSDAASQGVVSAEFLRNRAILRPADLMEYVPGMVVTQHSGDGKANQYFLRGMNLDHGTDFATTVNGVPVNMPTHGHSHGYSDLNILIPELVRRVEYRKGPYFASEGDFSSAGSADIVYRTRLEKPFSSLSVGPRGYLRGVAAGSREVSEGVTLLTAIERLNNNGPWTVPEGMRKANALFTLSGGTPQNNWSTSFSAHSAHWHSTDQVPVRLIESGSFQGQPFGRFDSLDPTDGASTQRLSLSGNWRRSDGDSLTRVQWYAIKYDLTLFSNFTYSLDRVTDQFAQTDSRTVVGGKASRTWIIDLGDGRAMQNTLGFQLRQDRIRVGLYDTATRQIQSAVRDDGVRQTLLGFFGESEISWTNWLRSVAGARLDQLSANVVSFSTADNSGQASFQRLSPKFSLIFGPWRKTEFFINSGSGFHTNDARGLTARLDARTHQPVARLPGFAGAIGEEVGVKTELIPTLQSTLAIWQLKFDSELVYIADAGRTEAGRASKRTGVEWANHWTPFRHLAFDLSLAWTRPRYTDHDPVGNYIANTVQRVANLSVSLRNFGGWYGSIGARYIGASPLTVDNSVRSAASMATHFRAGKSVSPELSVAIDVLNLTDRRNSDIAYFYTSRVAGEPASGVDGLHIHPAEPRTVRLTATLQF